LEKDKLREYAQLDERYQVCTLQFQQNAETKLWYHLQVNIWKIIYLNCGERYEEMIGHRSYAHTLSSCEIKAWKNSGLNGMRTHDFCDTASSTLNEYGRFFEFPEETIISCSFEMIWFSLCKYNIY